MNVSGLGPSPDAQSLFGGAENDLASAATSLSTPSSGDSTDLGVGAQFENAQSSESLGDALYGFDGRVLADQASATAQLFSALA